MQTQPTEHDAKIEVSIAVLTGQVTALSATMARIEALVDKQILEKRTPWPQLVGAIMLLLSPAAGIYWHFEESVMDLRLIDRDSMNERRELRAAVQALSDHSCVRDIAVRTAK